MKEAILRFCVVCGCNDLAACETAAGPCSWLRLAPRSPIGVCSGCAARVESWDGGDHSVSEASRQAAFLFALKALRDHDLTLYRQVDRYGEDRGQEPLVFGYAFEKAMSKTLMKESGVTHVEPVADFVPEIDDGVVELHFFNNTRDALLYLKERLDTGPERFLNFDMLAETKRGVVIAFVHLEREDRLPVLVVDHGNLAAASSPPPSQAAQIRVLEDIRESLAASYEIQGGPHAGEFSEPWVAEELRCFDAAIANLARLDADALSESR